MTKSVGDCLTWVGPFGGDWNATDSWVDTGSAMTARAAPDALDRVLIVGGATPLAVTGAGTADSIATFRSVMLSGGFAAGSLDVEGTLGVSGARATLSLGALGQQGAAVASNIVVDAASLSVAAAADLGTLCVTGGGRARLGGGATVTGGIAVDRASCVEIGGSGNFWSGWLKVYAGGTLSGSGAVTAATVLSGTILSSGMRFEGQIVGLGQIRMDAAGATVGQVAAGTRLVFATAGGVLTLAAPARMAGTVIGFAAGHAIDIQAAVTAASFRALSATTGVLTLSAAGGILATLALAGDTTAYAASRFLLVPDGHGGTLVLDTPVASAGMAGPGNATPHRAVWTGLSGAAWGAAGNWQDLTLGGPATIAPGSLDSVSIVGGAMPLVVTGAGAAAAVATFRSVVLVGQFAAATLDVEGTLMVAGGGSTLALGALGQAGAAVASSILVQSASLSVAGSASLGTLAVGVGGRATFAGGLSISSGITLDRGACAEVGGSFAFWAGWLKVYAGGTLAGSGVIGVSTMVAGTILASGLRFDGLLGGPGQVRLDAAGATVGQVTTGTRLVFAEAGAVLTLSAPSLMAGTLVGLAAGDAIDLAAVVTSASYRAVSPGSGVLTLSGAAGGLASLTVAGSAAAYATTRFLLLPDGQGGTLVLDVPPAIVAAAGVGNTTPHRLAWRGSSGASWAAASNWRDLTGSQDRIAGFAAPGSLDSVAIVGGAWPSVVTGAGEAAAIATFRSVLLDGVFAAGTLDVEGTMIVAGAGSVVTLGALGQAGAAVASRIVANGAGLSVSGSASLGTLGAVSGGRVRIGAALSVSGGVTVDRASCAEVGGAGGFWGGWLKVYAGGTLSGGGTIDAATVVSGTVLSSGLRFAGMLVGSGQIRMDAAGLAVDQVLAGTRLTFAAPGAVLTVNAPRQMAGTLIGFEAGDRIALPSLAAATAEYGATDASHGMLSVFDARHAMLASFALQGEASAYRAATFSVLSDGGGGVFITETAATPGDPGVVFTHPS